MKPPCSRGAYTDKNALTVAVSARAGFLSWSQLAFVLTYFEAAEWARANLSRRRPHPRQPVGHGAGTFGPWHHPRREQDTPLGLLLRAGWQLGVQDALPPVRQGGSHPRGAGSQALGSSSQRASSQH
eukprot:2101659-Pyramimonas_sp.AAC.1